MVSLIDARLSSFISDDDGGPIVMLNLLRFKPDGGRERYLAYVDMVGPLIQRHGAEIIYAGDGEAALAGESGQSWDAIALVRYPNRRAFTAMISEPDYHAADELRISSLVEAVLQPVRSIF